MGSEQVLKKSMLGGFKKEGVLNYVEQLQSEIIELKKEISNKSDFNEEIESLKTKNEDVSAEIAVITAKYDTVKAEYEALAEKNSDLINELDNAKKIITEYEEKQKIFEEKIIAIENKFTQLANGYCVSSDDSSKVNEAVLNAKSEITDANNRLITACINFESSSNALKSSVDNLLNVLTCISENLNLTDKGE